MYARCVDVKEACIEEYALENLTHCSHIMLYELLNQRLCHK